MEIRELPSPRLHISRIKAYWECDEVEPDKSYVTGWFDSVTLRSAPAPGRITGFDTTPGPPVPWWRQWWWRVCGCWPVYRCRHDR